MICVICKGEIDRSTAVSIISDRVVKTIGGCAGATAGAAQLKAVIDAATSTTTTVTKVAFSGDGLA